MIKDADKGSALVVWDWEESIQKVGDENVYEEVPDDAVPLLKTINVVLANVRKWGNLKRETFD